MEEAGFVLAGLAGAALLGERALRASFAGRARPRELALGVMLGALAFLASAAWVLLLDQAAPPPPGDGRFAHEPTWGTDPLWLVWLTWALLPALGEEWLCRGVLWEAARRALGAAGTVALTATLFALLHALNGGFLLEVPHRLVVGLVLGWLRLRTGSLGPCVLAHFVHNGFAILAE